MRVLTLFVLLLLSSTAFGQGLERIPVQPKREHTFNAASSYYEILGVSETATDSEIKSAYRKLARRHHPDVNPGDKTAPDRFRAIEEAYSVLMDPEKREKYDRDGAYTATRTNQLAETFLKSNEAERKEILDALALKEAGKLVQEIVEIFGKQAPNSAQHFRALISIIRHRHDWLGGDDYGTRQEAIEILAKSNSFRADVIQDYMSLVNDIFETSRRGKKFFSWSESNGYMVGVILAEFFTREVDPEVFRDLYPTMKSMLTKSHSVAWDALTKSLPRINSTHPELTTDIAKIYARVLAHLSVPGNERNENPTSGYTAAEGLLKISSLRPELAGRIRNVLLKAKSLLPYSFGWIIVRAAPFNPVANEVLQAGLSQDLSVEQKKRLDGMLEQEIGHFQRKMRESNDGDQIRAIESTIRMIQNTQGRKRAESIAAIVAGVSCRSLMAK